MANPEHLKILEQGVKVWNAWREENPDINPDLSEVILSRKDFNGINLSNVNCSKSNFTLTSFCNGNLSVVNFQYCKLISTNFLNANLGHSFLENCNIRGSYFTRAYLDSAYFSNSILIRTQFNDADLAFSTLFNCEIAQSDFSKARLYSADLQGAKIHSCNFENASLNEADLTNASITDSQVFGVSSWKIKREGLFQRNLKVTPLGEPKITVDDLEVAQFIYLMLNNQNIRNVIDTITSKAVLILGRFTEERKQVLDAIKDELRKRNYLPIVFDFDPSKSRNLTETVSILAKMSRFIIADLTDPSSIPHELQAIIPSTPSVPIVPIILRSQQEYRMFESFINYRWVLQIYRYDSPEVLIQNIIQAIIIPAEQKVEDLRKP